MDTEPTATSRRRTSIRTKLLIGFAVPILFVAIISGFQVRKAQSALNQTRDQVELASATGGQATYITALLDERNMTALVLLNLQGAVKLDRVKNLADARSKTDAAQRTFARYLDDAGAQVKLLYGKNFDAAASQLERLRSRTDAIPESQRNTQNAAAEDIYDAYADLIAGFHSANANAVRIIDDAQLGNRAHAIAAQTQSSDLLSLMSRTAALSFLYPITIEDRLAVNERFTQFKAAWAQAVDDLAEDPAAQKVMAGFYERPTMKRFYAAMKNYATTGEMNPADVPGLIADAADTKFPNGTDAWQAARTSLQHRGDQLISDAQTTRNWYLAVFVFATLISVLLALVIARSIARPLLSISEQAEDMAVRKLPDAVGSVLATPIGQDVVEPVLDPLAVNSNDEVADVAASINVVQQRALDLAVEQAMQRRNFADTFLNLGRRVQGLVARQLDFITELEDTEDDPEVLGDLFKLDHLATRIRRNAESLVVLAGVTRRQRRGEPAPVIDALRTALSEVDEYTRVDIGRVEDVRLPMSVAADLAHILAELIENGLNFSPPEADVEVAGRLVDGDYEITVVDHGIGMTDEQIETANRRLSGNESFTVAPSRYMGHFVAGHLATGLGIDVSLASPGKGTTATVRVPAELLVTRSEESEPHETTTTDTVEATHFRPEGPPAAPSNPAVRPDPDAPASSDSLKSLLSVHRRLAHPPSAVGPDRSPWAQRENPAPAGADGAPPPEADEIGNPGDT